MFPLFRRVGLYLRLSLNMLSWKRWVNLKTGPDAIILDKEVAQPAEDSALGSAGTLRASDSLRETRTSSTACIQWRPWKPVFSTLPSRNVFLFLCLLGVTWFVGQWGLTAKEVGSAFPQTWPAFQRWHLPEERTRTTCYHPWTAWAKWALPSFLFIRSLW